MNEIKIIFDAVSENESFARTSVAACMIPLNPTFEEINDVKTAVSEAVTNAVVHAYGEKRGKIEITCSVDGKNLKIVVTDYGRGIEHLDEAMEAFWTSKGDEERSGMGFTVMKTFTDELKVISIPGKGTSVYMVKKVS